MTLEDLESRITTRYGAGALSAVQDGGNSTGSAQSVSAKRTDWAGVA